MELVKAHGIGKWAEIARCLDGRTDQQCMGRWRRTLDPSVRKVLFCLCTLKTLANAPLFFDTQQTKKNLNNQRSTKKTKQKNNKQ